MVEILKTIPATVLGMNPTKFSSLHPRQEISVVKIAVLATAVLIAFFPSRFAHAQSFISLFCAGTWGPQKTQQEFTLEVETTSSFMVISEPAAAIGLIEVDGEGYVNKDMKCYKTDASYNCYAKNRVGISSASLSRYTGALKTETILVNDNDLIIGTYDCKKAPEKKF